MVLFAFALVLSYFHFVTALAFALWELGAARYVES